MALTTITDTVHRVDGTAESCPVRVWPPTMRRGTEGQPRVSTTRRTGSVVDGVFTMRVVPGLLYVQYDNGGLPGRPVLYDVPASSTAVSLSDLDELTATRDGAVVVTSLEQLDARIAAALAAAGGGGGGGAPGDLRWRLDPDGVPFYTIVPNRPDQVAPTAPGAPVATAGAGRVSLVSTGATDNVGVKAYLWFRGGNLVGTTTEPSFTETGLLPVAVTYTVQARDAAGNASTMSARSNTVTPTRVLTVPTAPRDLTGTPGDKRVSLSWLAPTDDGGSAVTDYVVQKSTGGSYSTVADGTSTALTAALTGLTNGTAVTARVAAVNAQGQGPWSVVSTAVTPAPAPPVTLVSHNFDGPDQQSGTIAAGQVGPAPKADPGAWVVDNQLWLTSNGQSVTWDVPTDFTASVLLVDGAGVFNVRVADGKYLQWQGGGGIYEWGTDGTLLRTITASGPAWVAGQRAEMTLSGSSFTCKVGTATYTGTTTCTGGTTYQLFAANSSHYDNLLVTAP